MVGLISAQIFVWDTNWILRDAPMDVTAWSHASKESFSLGKHNWTVLDPGCSGDQITLEMKLTGCQQKGEFTCNVGQCIRMEERCNQLPNCRDKSEKTGMQDYSSPRWIQPEDSSNFLREHNSKQSNQGRSGSFHQPSEGGERQ